MKTNQTSFIRILAGNMGDGWNDENAAADGYAKWLNARGIETEVLHGTSGLGGGSFDEDGEEIYDDYWEQWCESEDARQY